MTKDQFHQYLIDLNLFRWNVVETISAFEATISQTTTPQMKDFTTVLLNDDGTWWVRLAKVDEHLMNQEVWLEQDYL